MVSVGKVVTGMVSVVVDPSIHGGRGYTLQVVVWVSGGEPNTVPYGHGGGRMVRGAAEAVTCGGVGMINKRRRTDAGESPYNRGHCAGYGCGKMKVGEADDRSCHCWNHDRCSNCDCIKYCSDSSVQSESGWLAQLPEISTKEGS